MPVYVKLRKFDNFQNISNNSKMAIYAAYLNWKKIKSHINKVNFNIHFNNQNIGVEQRHCQSFQVNQFKIEHN